MIRDHTARIRLLTMEIDGLADQPQPPVEMPRLYAAPDVTTAEAAAWWAEELRRRKQPGGGGGLPTPSPTTPPTTPSPSVIPIGPMLWWESRTPNSAFGLKPPFSSASITGKVSGAFNIRVLHGNHPAHRAFITNRSAVSDFFARAMGDGVDALGLDDENETWDATVFAMIAREAKRYNLPFVDFPKCGHKLNGPGYRAGVNGYQGSVNLMNDLGVDASIEWLYGDAASNIGTDAMLEAAGFQGQRGLMHDLFRWQPEAGKGYKGKVEGWKVLAYCARKGLVFASVQHGHSGHPDPRGDAAKMTEAYGR